MKLIWIATAISAAMMTAASAGEVRIGAAKHDINGRESGADIQFQVTFDNNWFGFLDSYVGVSSNTDGKLNTFGGGVMVTKSLSDRWFAELQFGIITHDGRVDLPPPDLLTDGTIIDPADVNNPEVLARLARRVVLENEITYGCEVLFQTLPSIGRRLNDQWSAALYAEHLSHGKILCDDGKNEGLDNIGLRLSRRF